MVFIDFEKAIYIEVPRVCIMEDFEEKRGSDSVSRDNTGHVC